MKNKKRAFTLTELLVVVIVLGTLAAVAVPKFSRVLETRRTGEAEEMLAAVRMEQEKRCSLGQNYTGDLGNIPTVAYAKTSASQGKTNNYTYTLTSTGIEASRSGKDYVIKIPSYKTGQMCCEGSGCDALNKSYPSCASLSLPASDECAASDVVQPTDPCDTDPNSCACSSYAAGHRCECDADYASLNACECNPSTAACCGEGEEWNPQTGACEPTDECIENYGEAVKVSAGSDTCDGDGTSKYTCDGHFNGTCTDVYTANATSMSFSSVTQDPFLMFKNNYWLAGNTGLCGNGEYCGMNGSMTVCCPEGYYCDWDDYVLTPGSNPNETRTGTCKVGQRPDTPEEVDICAEDEVWDASLGECVKISEGEGSEEFEPVVWTYKREVTCCGDGQIVSAEQTCAQNPNQAKCCTSQEQWNSQTGRCEPKQESCEENPDQEQCCLNSDFFDSNVAFCCNKMSDDSFQKIYAGGDVSWYSCCQIASSFEKHPKECCMDETVPPGYDLEESCYDVRYYREPVDKWLTSTYCRDDQTPCWEKYPFNEYPRCGSQTCNAETEGQICLEDNADPYYCNCTTILENANLSNGWCDSFKGQPLEQCKKESTPIYW